MSGHHFVADQGQDDGFWYVRRNDEMKRPPMLRDWVCIVAYDEFQDGGKSAAEIIAKALSGRGEGT
ncbi:MAG: hypothetical protein RLZZ127_50 [Planctomycetota bacterium]|jgi:hypothetical protein